jgi:signal-transduction protein with cAMP-binding, CBS, and nucleotidyltransferase domain
MKEIPEIVDFLRVVPGFETLDDEQAAAFARSIEISYYREGDDILTIGSRNEHLHATGGRRLLRLSLPYE